MKTKFALPNYDWHTRYISPPSAPVLSPMKGTRTSMRSRSDCQRFVIGVSLATRTWRPVLIGLLGLLVRARKQGLFRQSPRCSTRSNVTPASG